jgi:septum formation protein
MDSLILASASPRRRELLASLDIPFDVVPSSYEETFDDRPPLEQALFLSEMKVRKVIEDHPDLGKRVVVGADTVLDLDGRLIGKAPDRSTARRYLELISGRSHKVITALSIHNGSTGELRARAETSTVDFALLSRDEIEAYLDTGEWEGAAGAYRIQGRASFFVRGIKGCFFNVVGLPIRLFYVMLQSQGISLIDIS